MAKKRASKSPKRLSGGVRVRSQADDPSGKGGGVQLLINLRPLRLQIEAMHTLISSGELGPDQQKLLQALDTAAQTIKASCGGMGANITFT